jgi:membrane protein required for colicin V production
MNWLDVIILVIIAISTVIGVKVGIIKAFFAVAGGIIGVFLAGRFSGSLADRLTFISDQGIAGAVAFTIILIAVLIIAIILAVMIKWATSAVMLGWINRLGGAVLGLVLGAIFCAALLTMWVNFQGISSAVSDSLLARFLVAKFPIVLAFLPAEFDSVRSFFK